MQHKEETTIHRSGDATIAVTSDKHNTTVAIEVPDALDISQLQAVYQLIGTVLQEQAQR